MKYFTRPDNQQKIILPLNSISEKLWYTNDEDNNVRLIVSALTDHPIVWKLTKIENIQPFGLVTLTLYQDRFDEHRDYVNLETGEMYADYYSVDITPTDAKETTESTNIATIHASSSTIKVGGSYKSLEITMSDSNNEDITDNYSISDFTWTCDIDGDDWTENVVWRSETTLYQTRKIKLKFPSDSSQLGKILNVKCKIFNKAESETLYAESQFELIE